MKLVSFLPHQLEPVKRYWCGTNLVSAVWSVGRAVVVGVAIVVLEAVGVGVVFNY